MRINIHLCHILCFRARIKRWRKSPVFTSKITARISLLSTRWKVPRSKQLVLYPAKITAFENRQFKNCTFSLLDCRPIFTAFQTPTLTSGKGNSPLKAVVFPRSEFHSVCSHFPDLHTAHAPPVLTLDIHHHLCTPLLGNTPTFHCFYLVSSFCLRDFLVLLLSFGSLRSCCWLCKLF